MLDFADDGSERGCEEGVMFVTCRLRILWGFGLVAGDDLAGIL